MVNAPAMVNFARVRPGRVAYRIALNSLDTVWAWVCDTCGKRYGERDRAQIEIAVALHRCPHEPDFAWLMASRRRFRHK